MENNCKEINELIRAEGHSSRIVTPKTIDRLEHIKRDEFSTDDEYIDALTKEALKISTPEYIAMQRKILTEIKMKEQEESEERYREQFEEYRKNAKLGAYDVKKIEDDARERVKLEVAQGKCSVSQMGDRIIEYTKRAEEEAINEKASGAVFNDWLRGK